MLGTAILHYEVINITALGLTLFLQDGADETKEYFVPFTDYGQFKSATVEQILNVKMLSTNQIHWPELDIDIETEALQSPQNYPLEYVNKK